MKNIYCLIILFLSVTIVVAQPTLKFYKVDGSMKQYSVSDISSISFANPNTTTFLTIYQRDSVLYSKQVINIDSITFLYEKQVPKYVSMYGIHGITNIEVTQIDSIIFKQQALITKTIDSIFYITYPVDSVQNSDKVYLIRTTDTPNDTGLQIITTFYEASGSLGYTYKVNLGTKLPAILDYPITIVLPKSVNLVSGFIPTVYANIRQETYEEEFYKLVSTYNPSTNTMLGKLPVEAFSNLETTDSSYEAVVRILFTPTSFSKPSNKAQTTVIDLARPLKTNLSITSQIQKHRKYGCNEKDVNKCKPHLGTDFNAVIGTPVFAVCNGIVLDVGKTQKKFTKNNIPYGEITYITLEDSKTGEKYRYLHLNSYSVKRGDKVSKGYEIGKSGNSGYYIKDGKSTQYPAHLHLEYFINNTLIPENFDDVEDIVFEFVRDKVESDIEIKSGNLKLQANNVCKLKLTPIDSTNSIVEAVTNPHFEKWVHKWTVVDKSIVDINNDTSYTPVITAKKKGSTSLKYQINLLNTYSGEILERPVVENSINIIVGLSPVITTINPVPLRIGDVITITGTNFGKTQGTNFVLFNDIKPQSSDYISWTDTEIKVVIPNGVVSGKVSVTTDAIKSNEKDYLIIPVISTILPTSGIEGDEITITGNSFGASRGTSVVNFGTSTATVYTYWSDTQIKVKVPTGVPVGTVKVSVVVSGQKSNEKDFIVNPYITSLTPTSGVVGDTITITGNSFGASRGTSVVNFGTSTATVYTYWSDTQIKVKVPTGVPVGTVKVSVVVSGQKSNEKDFIVNPYITSLTPTSGVVGDTITITGNSFGASRGTSVVNFGTSTATVYTYWSDTQIKVKVPTGVPVGTVKVSVVVSGQKSNEKDFIVNPYITSLTPTSGVVGDTITITGNSFGASRGTSVVNFGTSTVTVYTYWSDTQIKVKVPTGVPVGTVKVSVVVSGQKSNEKDFIICTFVNYESVTIGTQIWMKKNLDVSKYRNGDDIPQVTDSAQWMNLTTGAWCYYNNDPAMGAIYGKLYNWYAVVDPRGLAPCGWHVANDDDFDVLEGYLGTNAGGKMKESDTTHWQSPNTGATNESGFTLLPGGRRSHTNGSSFLYVRGGAYWWSADNVKIYDRSIFYSTTTVWTTDASNTKYIGQSVRCVKD